MATDQKSLFGELEPKRPVNGNGFQRLFVPKLLEGAAIDFDKRTPDRERAYQLCKKWAELESSGKLYKMNERKLEGEFFNDIFTTALGYTKFSDGLPQWDFQPGLALEGQEVDGAIGFFSTERSEPPRVMVELKGPKVDVDRHRSQGRTPVQQCWDYLYLSPASPWGIVCNCVTFRLYHRNKTPRVYEQYKLRDLADINKFREFYYIFERGGFLPTLAGQSPRCDALLSLSENKQKDVGDELYTLYREQRKALINYLRRPPHDKSVDQAIYIAQKLLDRVIFIAFCQYRLLLPESTLERTWREVPPHSLATNPRWQNFKDLFRSVDKGNLPANISAFNGGLFAEDSAVDNLQLDDQWTDFFHEIGGYDFKDEVNVDVLGHLFEQSISDLESLRIDPDVELAKEKTKTLGKRKREGVYYTPTNITQYVVRETLGRCLQERFARLAHTLKVDPVARDDHRKVANWRTYQLGRWQILRELRVCDPACGSGAFLIQAFDYLEELYTDVAGELALFDEDEADVFEAQISDTILHENLFGVDLSEEAVEITRLSLWIRTAERGKTLANLSHNIQCGNSVVDDPQADPRAFNWSDKFPEIWAAGKFDCILGNPPYVKLQNFRKREPKIAAFLLDRYKAAQTGNFDLYLTFMERGLELLKPDGRLGMIAPNVWLFNEYGAGLRELVAERRALERFVDFKSFQVFRDATTYTALQFFAGTPQDTIAVADAHEGRLEKLAFYPVAYDGLGRDSWSLVDAADRAILDKMRQSGVTLEEATGQIFQGLITSADSIYHLIKTAPGKYYSEAALGTVEIEDEMVRPLVSGEDAVPFATPPTDKYLIFPYLVSDDECRLLTVAEMKKHRRCWEYLKQHETALRARESSKFDDDQWYRFGRNQNIDKNRLPKLGVPQTVNRLAAFNDLSAERYFNNVRVNGILPREDGKFDLWYILSLLNSNALDFFFRKTAKPKDRDYFEANRQFIAPLPIPQTRAQKKIGELAKSLAKLHSARLAIENGVVRRMQVDFASPQLLDSPLPPKVPGKLRDFDALPVGDLLNELERYSKRRFKPAERAEWDKFFSDQARDLQKIKRQIEDAMRELNERVYRLYGLTDVEIAHIETAIGVRRPVIGAGTAHANAP